MSTFWCKLLRIFSGSLSSSSYKIGLNTGDMFSSLVRQVRLGMMQKTAPGTYFIWCKNVACAYSAGAICVYIYVTCMAGAICVYIYVWNLMFETSGAKCLDRREQVVRIF